MHGTTQNTLLTVARRDTVFENKKDKGAKPWLRSWQDFT